MGIYADLTASLLAGKGNRQPRAIVQEVLIDTAGGSPAVQDACPAAAPVFAETV